MNHPIAGTTRLFGLFGSPVEHSLSPLMHNLSFETLGIDAVYLAFDATPDTIGQAITAVKALRMGGANVTMPCKTAVIPYLDRLSDVAKMSGAVNTIVVEDGVLCGHNTDGIGFLRMLEQAGVSPVGKRMVILGAGGATSSIVAQAALSGVSEIALFNRKDEFFEKACSFAATITEQTACRVTLFDLADQSQLREQLLGSAVLLHATGVGMGQLVGQSLVSDRSLFSPDVVVCDLIYHPAETKLLADAKAAGCRTLNGLEMLLLQGAEAFFCWTGEQMPLSLVRDAFCQQGL